MCAQGAALHGHDFYESVKDLHPVGDNGGQIRGLLFARQMFFHRVKLSAFWFINLPPGSNIWYNYEN